MILVANIHKTVVEKVFTALYVRLCLGYAILEQEWSQFHLTVENGYVCTAVDSLSLHIWSSYLIIPMKLVSRELLEFVLSFVFLICLILMLLLLLIVYAYRVFATQTSDLSTYSFHFFVNNLKVYDVRWTSFASKLMVKKL